MLMRVLSYILNIVFIPVLGLDVCLFVNRMKERQREKSDK